MRSGKKSQGQETGLGNRGSMKVPNDTKLVLNEHYENHSEPLAFRGPLFTKPVQYLDRDFFATSYRKTALDVNI